MGMGFRNLRAVLVGIAFLLLSLPLAFAQGPDETYRLQIEDVVKIQIYNENQVNAEAVVGLDGNVSAPFIGSIKAAGKTVDELARDMTELYVQKLRLRDPKVSVTILRYRELRATIIGSVRTPGTYPIRSGDTVITLLSRGGGLLDDRADPYRATLRKGKSQEQIPLDLYSLIYRGDTSQNYEIEDGDELIIPQETKLRVNLLGAIQRPSQYPYREGMRLSELIALGGGEIPGRTMFSRTWVFRPRPGMSDSFERIESNMVRFFNNGDYRQDVVLQPGDIVLINKTKTPLPQDIGSYVNSIFIFNSLIRQGILGFNPF